MPRQKKVLNSDTISHVNLGQLLCSSSASVKSVCLYNRLLVWVSVSDIFYVFLF